MALQTGTYEPRRTVQVYVWPKPDANGDEEVWVDKVDPATGQPVGRERLRDSNTGEVVKRYNPPAGFKNVPSFDGTENYVLFEEGRGVVRDPAGNAIVISEGRAVVVQPDGNVSYLDDEYAHYLFGNAHERVSDAVDSPESTDETATESAEESDGKPSDDELAEFRAWKAAQEKDN